MDAQALGNWLTLEIITTGNEQVWFLFFKKTKGTVITGSSILHWFYTWIFPLKGHLKSTPLLQSWCLHCFGTKMIHEGTGTIWAYMSQSTGRKEAIKIRILSECLVSRLQYLPWYYVDIFTFLNLKHSTTDMSLAGFSSVTQSSLTLCDPIDCN